MVWVEGNCGGVVEWCWSDNPEWGGSLSGEGMGVGGESVLWACGVGEWGLNRRRLLLVGE